MVIYQKKKSLKTHLSWVSYHYTPGFHWRDLFIFAETQQPGIQLLYNFFTCLFSEWYVPSVEKETTEKEIIKLPTLIVTIQEVTGDLTGIGL